MAGQDWDPFADPADTGAEITKCVVEDFQPWCRAGRSWQYLTRGVKLAGLWRKKLGPLQKHQVLRRQSFEQAEWNGCPIVTGETQMFGKDCLDSECTIDIPWLMNIDDILHQERDAKSIFNTRPDRVYATAVAAYVFCHWSCQVGGQGAGQHPVAVIINHSYHGEYVEKTIRPSSYFHYYCNYM